MDFIYPLLSVIAESVATTADKLNYNKNKIRPRELLFLLFGTMVVGSLISLFFIHQTFPVFSTKTGILIAFMVAVSFGQNFFDYVGLSTKNLSFREPINNLQPILASFLAYALFPSERKIKYVIAIFVGVIIMYIGSSDRRFKLALDRGTAYLFLGIVCSSILSNVYKFGLETIPPTYLFLFRAAGVLLLSQLFFKPNLRSLRRNQVALGVGAGIIYVVGNLSQLYSIKYLGLNFTIMILLLGPAIVYLASNLILKEKVQRRQIVTSALLLIIIIWATYL
jgi:drug/metabolite transporter (DMT)-like permease